MAIVYHLGVAPASDYSRLVPLCVHSMVGDSYADHLTFLENERKRLRANGIKVIDVPIDAIGFQKWLNGQIATPSDLCKYANQVIEKQKFSGL